MSFDRKVDRRTARARTKLLSGGRTVEGPDGRPIHVLGSSQTEAIAALVAMPIPPAPPGAGDTDRDDIDPVAYRQLMNARKRARRAQRGR